MKDFRSQVEGERPYLMRYASLQLRNRQAAEVKREQEVADDERVLHTERVYGKVTRSFTLPQELDEAKAEAKFKDGVLELVLPKKQAAARKQITIQ